MLLRPFIFTLFLLLVTTATAHAATTAGSAPAAQPATPALSAAPNNATPAPQPANNNPAPGAPSTTGVTFGTPDPNAGQATNPDDDNTDEYAELTWPNLARTMAHFNALDFDDPIVIDEYSIITECDLFEAYYQDDFKWNTVRQAVRDSISMNSATYPIKYRYPIKMQLDRYDFNAKLFRFRRGSVLNNVNMFKLFSAAHKACGARSVKSLPHDFRVVLAAPVFLEGLPFTPKEAQNVLRRMDDDQDINRLLYTDFNIRVLYIEPLHKQLSDIDSQSPPRYRQNDVHGWSDIRIDARLDSIKFYTDPARKHLIYTYVP